MTMTVETGRSQTFAVAPSSNTFTRPPTRGGKGLRGQLAGTPSHHGQLVAVSQRWPTGLDWTELYIPCCTNDDGYCTCKTMPGSGRSPDSSCAASPPPRVMAGRTMPILVVRRVIDSRPRRPRCRTGQDCGCVCGDNGGFVARADGMGCWTGQLLAGPPTAVAGVCRGLVTIALIGAWGFEIRCDTRRHLPVPYCS